MDKRSERGETGVSDKTLEAITCPGKRIGTQKSRNALLDI